MNFLTPMSENLLLLSEDFRGGMARGLEPDSGFVSCACVCVCEKTAIRIRTSSSM